MMSPDPFRRCGALEPRRQQRWMLAWLLLGFGLAASAQVPGGNDPLTVEGLLARKELNPKAFARLFRHFTHRFSVPIQPAETFLRNRAGDCDDYAVLADFVLHRVGFGTRMVHVNLAGSNVGHAVCYVDQANGYLDYNNRIYAINVERSDENLRAIATKVAKSLGQNWVNAAEFTYSYELRRKFIRHVVVKTEPPEKDPDRPGRVRPPLPAPPPIPAPTSVAPEATAPASFSSATAAPSLNFKSP